MDWPTLPAVSQRLASSFSCYAMYLPLIVKALIPRQDSMGLAHLCGGWSVRFGLRSTLTSLQDAGLWDTGGAADNNGIKVIWLLCCHSADNEAWHGGVWLAERRRLPSNEGLEGPGKRGKVSGQGWEVGSVRRRTIGLTWVTRRKRSQQLGETQQRGAGWSWEAQD